MRLIDADKFIEKLKEHKSLFCKNRVEFIALSDKDKARVDEIDTCIAELVNAEEVPHAQLSTNLAEVGMDCISRQAAIEAVTEALRGLPVVCKDIAEEAIKQLPPAQPTPDQNGDLWITVPDIDKVTCIYVQESKSKFCRIFYEER